MSVQRRPHLLVLVGIPGSGKTTYVHRLRVRCPALRVVSPDAIREQLSPGYAHGRVDVRHIDDRRVFRIAYAAVDAALRRGEDVAFDATNATVTRRQRLVQLAHRHDALVTARYFPITIAEAARRNVRRARRVPHVAIVSIARSLVPPHPAEGFDRVVVHRRYAV